MTVAAMVRWRLRSWLFGRSPKLAMVWNILAGHPVAYQLRIVDGTVHAGRNGMMVDCEITGTGTTSVWWKDESG